MRTKIFTTVILFISLFFIYQNADAQWMQKINGMGNGKLVSSFATSGNNIFAGTDIYGVWLSTDNGENWAQTQLKQTILSLAISGNNIFAGSEGIYLSTNNGQNWIQTGLNNIFVWSLLISGNNIFAGSYNDTNPSGVWLSTNNGQNWTQTSLNDKSVISLAVSGNNIFAGTVYYGVFISTNNGQNWMQTALNNKSVRCLTISGMNIFAGVLDTGVYLSTNNGQNWTQTALNNLSILSLSISGNNIFAGTAYYGVWLSTNNGQNWIQKNQGFNVIPDVSALYISSDYIFAGTYGQSVWRRSLADIIGIKKISTEIPSAFSLGQNYPNPFNAVTSIKFKVTSKGGRSQKTEVRLKVYDLNGREIRKLVNDELNPGTYEVQFDAGDLPSGVYFYRMEAGKFMETRKLILLK